MNKLRSIIILFLFIISFNLISAGRLGSFDKNECVDLIQTCDNCTYVNITQITFQPTSKIFLDSEVSMTKIGTRFNYTFCNTSNYGRYVYDSYGNLDGIITVSSDDFFIGEELDITQGFILFGQFAIIALFFVLGLTFSKENWKLKSFFFMMATGMGVILLNSIRIVAAQSGRLNTMGNVGLIIGIISFMFIGILLVYFTIDVIDSLKRKKERKWVG
jgi:hypothetical protein